MKDGVLKMKSKISELKTLATNLLTIRKNVTKKLTKHSKTSERKYEESGKEGKVPEYMTHCCNYYIQLFRTNCLEGIWKCE